MVGLRQAWRVSGLTKEHAMHQGPAFHEFGRILRAAGDNALSGEFSPASAAGAKLVPLARKMLDLRRCHDDYVLRGTPHQHDSAVEFLVCFAALALGLDGAPFDWSATRNLSQGVYTCMIDTPAVHRRDNFSNFDAVCEICRSFVPARQKVVAPERVPGLRPQVGQPSQIEGAHGEFGYEPTNPIPVDGNWYCRRLRCPAGHPYWFHRLGNIGRGPDGHIVDQIEAQCFGGESRIHLFFDMYHTAPCSMVPDGLSMGSEAGRGSTRGRVTPFPEGLFEGK